MLTENEKTKIEKIVSAIEKTGYKPYSQIVGYLETGDARYITRTDNARELIKSVSTSSLKEYLNSKE